MDTDTTSPDILGFTIASRNARGRVARLGPPPATMVAGVPHHVDGRMMTIAEAAGATAINTDRMWHYTEGVRNWAPIWPNHGIRILPGPSSLWFDALGNRLPPPCLRVMTQRRMRSHMCSSACSRIRAWPT